MIGLPKNGRNVLKPKKIIMKNLQKRTMMLLAVIIILGFGSSIFGLAYSQLVKGDYFKTRAETQQLSDTSITDRKSVV